MSDRIVPMPAADYPPTRVNRSETAAPAEEPRVPAKPVRDWKSLPDTIERCVFCASVLLQSMGPNTITVVRRWVQEGEVNGITHIGTHASCRGVLAALETPGLVTPRPRQPSWAGALEAIDEMKPLKNRSQP